MPQHSFEIVTARLRLRPWRRSDRYDFAAMNADREVMADLGGPLTRTASDRKLERYVGAYDRHGFTRWAVDASDGGFLGYVGVMPVGAEHPLGVHHEIGWRLARAAWGHGYATEAAAATLDDVFDRVGLTEVLAYTAADNLRSRDVMRRLGLQRDEAHDFTNWYEGFGSWSGLVWATTSDRWAGNGQSP